MPYPSSQDTAWFSTDGNGQSIVDLTGLPAVRNITFDSPSVGAFTLGTGAANSQTLVLADSGEIKLSSTAGNSQTFNCAVQLGTDRSGQYYYLRNDNPAQSLTFNDLSFVAQEVGGGTGNKTIAINGTGPVNILGSIRQNGVATWYLHHNNSSTVTLAGSNVVTILYMYGGPSSVLDIGSQELVLNSNGGNVLNCTLGGTIIGTGKLRFSTWDSYSSAGYNYADLNVTGGRTLTINCEITGLGGFESNSGTGMFVLNGTNTFLGHMNLATAGGTVSVRTIGNRGVASNCGMGTNLYFANTSRLLYTGAGENTDRVIVMNANPTIEQAGSGTLRFTATPLVTGGARTLYLQGSTSGVGEFSASLSNTLGNTLSVIKYGAGTWIFSGTNSYTGSTTLHGGKLLLPVAGSISNSATYVNNGAVLAGSGRVLNAGVTVAAGGVLAPGDLGTVGALSMGSTLAMTNAVLCYDLVSADAVGVATDKVAVAGALTVNGTNTVVLSFPNGTAPAGTYTLMTYASKTGTGVFQLAAPYPNAALTASGTSLTLTVVGSSYATKWTGSQSTSWDGTDLNWTNGTAAVAYTAGDAVLFDDAASQFSVASSAPVLPSSTLINNSASSYAISAAIGGTGAVYKLGSGLASLGGANTYSGQTEIIGGMLKIDGTGQLGGGNYATNLIVNGDFVYASSAAQTNSGVISGGGNLTQFGSGLLTLSGNNTYLGMTVVTSGVLRVQHPNGLGNVAMGTIVAKNATLDLSGTNNMAAEFIDLYGTLSSSSGSNTINGTVNAQNGAVFNVASANATLVFNASIPATGSNTITKTGPGMLRFLADPNPNGMFIIDEGTVELQHSGSTDLSFTINPNGTLREITASDLGDNYTIQVDGVLDMRTSDGIGGLMGSGLVTNSGANASTLTVGNGNQSGAFSGAARNGAGAATIALTKTGTGFLTLSGPSTFSGGLTFSGGQLNINYGGSSSANSALGVGTFTIGSSLIDNTSDGDVTILPAVAQNWNSDFTFIGSRSLNLGPGSVTLGANRTVTVATNTLTVGGAIGGAYTLTKNGAGSLVLNGANTYSGSTTVNGGALVVNGSTVAGSVTTVNAGTLGGSGTIAGPVSLVAGAMLAPATLGTVGTLTLSGTTTNVLTLNGNTLVFDLSTAADVCDKVKLSAGTGKMVLNGTNNVALAFPAGGAPAGAYTLMTFPGGVTTNAGGALKLLTSYPNSTLAMVGTNLVLTLSSTTTPGIVWTGAASGKWDGGDPNWTADGTTPTAYADGNSVNFLDNAGNFSVYSGSPVSPATVMFNNSVSSYDVSAQLSGTAPLGKVGTAGVTLTGFSNYNPVSIYVSDGPLTFAGSSQLNGGSYSGSIVDNGYLTFSNANPQVLGGIISGGGALTKYGNGTLTLSGSNFYSGVTTINAGTLRLTHPYGLGSTINGTVINPVTTLELSGNISTLSEAVTLYGVLSNPTGSNTLNGTLTLNAGASIDVASGSVLVLKAFQANGPFTKTGTGWMRLTTDPNGNGVMTVREGTAEIAAGTMDASVVVNSGATLVATVANAFNDSLTRVQLDAGSTYVLRQWDQVGGLAGAGTITQDTPVQAWLCIGNNGFSEVYSGAMQNGSGVLGLSKIGSGSQLLTGANTYTGATVVGYGTLLVNSPGSLAGTAVTVSNSAAFGGSGSVGGPVTFQYASALIAGGSDSIGTLALGSSLALNNTTLLFDLPASGTVCDKVTVAGALALEGVNTVVLSFPSGSVSAGDYTLMTFASRSGSGSFAPLTSYPGATLELTSTSLVLHVTGGGMSGLTWNGAVSAQWDGGVLNWKKAGANASFTTGDTVLFDDSTPSQYTVASAGNVAPSYITINNSIYPYYLAAPITGTAPLIKSGTAMACINNSTSYNPPFIAINAGTLLLANSAQFNSGSYAGNVVIGGLNGVNASFNHNSSANQTMSGLFSGLGSLAKSGGGTLTLTGTNFYLGGTSLSSGTLIGKTAPTVFGPGVISISAGTLEMQADANTSFTNSVTTSAACTLKSGRATTGNGTTLTLGTLSVGNYTLTVSVGSNVNINSPYGLVFGTTTLSAATPNFSVNNNGTGLGTLTLGALSGNNNMTKSGSGMLFLPVGNTSRSSVSTTLSAGTLKLGAPGSLGTSGATLTLTSGILDLAIDSSVLAHNTTVSGNVTSQCDRATANAAGITHTLGTLSMGAYSLFVTNGPNVLANSVYGLTFGATTLTGNSVFDVAEPGVLTLGAISGNYTVTKRNHGTLKLGGTNTYTTATTVNQGKLLGVAGGSSASSAVTLQSAYSANAVAKLGVLCSITNGQWTCASLTLAAASAPATTNPVLEFAYSVQPSGTVAPLRVAGAATFTATPSAVAVYLGSLSVTNGVFPLMTVGSTSTYPTPALTVYGGYAGSTLGWVGNTLYLTLNGSPSPIVWSTGAAGSGVWDVNNSANLVWKDSAGAATSYQEPFGALGNSVLFSDSNITANTTVTLNSFVNPTGVAFSNDTYSYTFVGAGGIVGNFGLTKYGTNLLSMGLQNSYTGFTTVAAGTLRLTSGALASYTNSDVVVGCTPYTNALLRIESGATVSNRWLTLGVTNKAVGAVVNKGKLVIAGGANVTNFVLGLSSGSYGYYRHDTLEPLTTPETGIGGAYNGDGVMDVMRGAFTNATYFQLNRAYSGFQNAELNVLGGALLMPNNSANAHLFYGSSAYGTGIINVANGGLLASLGTATELDMIKASTVASATAVINVRSGGTLQATRVRATQSAGLAMVNFDGGTLKAGNNGYLLLGGANVDRTTVCAGGMTVDTDSKSTIISQPLVATTGNGVTAIPVLAAGTGYVGRPIVSIIGGGGTGATALAEFDPDSGLVTAVTITSPGYGYTSAPTVAFIGGGGTPPTLDTVSIGTVASGGLTKVGLGVLTLNGANTYGGATVISNGTLKIDATNALPVGSAVVVAGGVLDLNGYALTNASIDLVSGSIINGKLVSPTIAGADAGLVQAQIVSTSGLVKEGTGTLIVASAASYPGDTVINGGTLKLSGRKPGLYEGRTAVNFDLTAANPKTATPLSTRYANVYYYDNTFSGGVWSNPTTYIYSGYLWNDSPTNETWTFYKGFDDNARILLNGVSILHNTLSSDKITSNATVNAGWNTFELRLGQGAGAAGANNTAFPDIGIGFDRKGRNTQTYSFFQTLTDPGDGSLLTLTNVFDLANANILPTNSAVVVAAGSTLDLGGIGQTVGGLSGSGLVTNGSITVNGTIAPAGIGTIGTLTLATTTATLTGTLRVDLSDDGSGDLLAVAGDVYLSNLSLTVEPGSLLDAKKEYTLMTHTGARYGTFKSKSAPKGWGVDYRAGSVVFKYHGGTLITVY